MADKWGVFEQDIGTISFLRHKKAPRNTRRISKPNLLKNTVNYHIYKDAKCFPSPRPI